MPRDNDDDDDDRPRRRRRDEGDGEDDRPRSRRREDDDDYEEDDRPRRRRRRDDEDDDWDQPRKPGKKKGGSGSTVLIVVAVALLGCCGGAGVIGYFGFQRMGDARGRALDSNHLKQIGIAFHNHHDVNGSIPPNDGRLSWRVHLLPYIEQGNLHRQFDLTQPWDGPRNRQLANTPVRTYTSALDGEASTQARYRVFTGPGTLYDPVKPVRGLFDIKDGTSNTLFAVEAAETVPWPQPKELPFTPNGPLPALGHPDRNIVLMVLADGSVRAVDKKKVNPAVMQALITPRGGEPVDLDW